MADRNKEFTERFKKRLSELGISNPVFAKKIGIGYSTLMNYFNKDNFGRVPEWPQLIKIAQGLNVSVDWLLSGKDFKETKKEFTQVPKYKAVMSCGPGSLEVSDQIETNLAFRTDWLNTNIGHTNDLALFGVRGDSMLPTIGDGDVVMVDLSDRDVHTIMDGKIYAFRENDTVRVKRLEWQSGALVVSSDNVVGNRVYTADLSIFYLIGRVVWIGRVVK